MTESKPRIKITYATLRNDIEELHALYEAGGPPLRRSEVAMVGDDLDSDVAGARRAGLRGPSS